MNKTNLASIELNLLADGFVELLVKSVSPIDVQTILDGHETYENGFVVRKVIERFNEFADKISEDLEHLIGSV
jgi:hypothetical protein